MAVVNLTVAEYLAAQGPFDPTDTVTIVDSGAAIAALSPAQIAQLGVNNVDALDADDNLLTLDTSQLDALGTVTRLTDTDLVTFRISARCLMAAHLPLLPRLTVSVSM